jgi:hypothetical protein
VDAEQRLGRDHGRDRRRLTTAELATLALDGRRRPGGNAADRTRSRLREPGFLVRAGRSR